MRKIISINLFIFFICNSGCNQNIEEKIRSQGQDCAKKSNCKIVISEFTRFSWDKMFVFDSPQNLDAIEKAIGVQYSEYYKEFTRPIIFLKDNRIVHYENNEANIEDMVDGQVIFDYPDSIEYEVYTPNTAKFNMIQKTLGNKTYYLLKAPSK